MRTRRYGSQQRSRRATLETRVFWLCFAVMAGLTAIYGTALLVFLLLSSHVVAWHVLGCVLLALVPVWLTARFASAWIANHIEAPMRSIVEQCQEIEAGQGPRRLAYSDRCGELGSVATAINSMLSHLDEIIVRQHRCFADAAHELRTPLTAQAVVGENVLAKRPSSSDLREAVGSMLEEAKHMKRLIESLLSLSRASLTRSRGFDTPRKKQPLDLSDLARSCTHSLQILAEEKQQSIEMKLGGPLWVAADLTLLRQALLNVIHNSIEHCPEGVHIDIETVACAKGDGVIRVRDDGPGIPLDEQPRVFERFYRGTQTSRRRGLGLGLAIARAVLEAQGGRLLLSSVYGAGCCFTLMLPLTRPPTRLSQDVVGDDGSGVELFASSSDT